MENVRKWEIQIVRNVVNTCHARSPSLLPLLKCLQSLESVAGVPKYGYLRRIRSIGVKQMTCKVFATDVLLPIPRQVGQTHKIADKPSFQTS